MPLDGYNRKFYPNMFPGGWPLGTSMEAEIDFIAHSDDVKSIPTGTFRHPDNIHVTGSVSNCNIPDLSAPFTSPTTMSPERMDPATGTTPTAATISTSVINPITQVIKYIVGEVTYGGKSTVMGKLKQLEKDCKICLAKMPSQKIITHVVSVAVLVNPYNFIIDVFNELQTNTVDYPNLGALYHSGRFIYIRYTETHLTMLEEQGTQLQNLQEGLTEASSNINTLQTQITTLQTQNIEISSTLQEILALLNQKKTSVET